MPKHSVKELTEKLKDLQAVETRLKESEEKFRLAFHTNPDAINLNRVADGMYIDINDGFTKLTGYTRQDVIGKTSIELNIWANPVDREQLVSGLKKDGYVDNYEARFRCKNSEIKIGSMSARLFNFNGEIVILSITRDITKRKQAEDALGESEERFRSIINNTDTGYFFIDSNGIFRDVNKAYIKLYKFHSSEEIIGKHFTAILQNQDIGTSHEIFQGILNGKSEYLTGEFKRTCKDGSIGYHTFSTRPVSRMGKVVGIEGFIIDTTGRRLAEDELKKLSTAVKQSPVSVVITDPDGNIEYVNPKFCKVTGYSAEEVIGKNPNILKSNETTKETYEQLWKTILTGKEWRGEFHNKKKNGQLYWEDAAISPILSEDGKITHFLAVKEDITLRKQAEKELQDNEHKLIEAQKIAKLGYYSFNVKTGFWTNSAELDEIFGIDNKFKKDVNGWLKIVHPEFRDAMAKYLNEHVLQQHNKFDKQYKIINSKDRKEKWVHGLGSLNFDKDNNPVEMFGTIQDITNRKKLEEQLAQSQKMESIGKFAAGLAHDYNNIITAINGFAQLASSRTEKNSYVWNFLNEILKAGDRAAKLTSQLLMFSRKQVIEPKIVNINDVIKKMDRMLYTLAGENFNLKFRLGDHLPPVNADITQIEQILVNLVLNARDAIIEKTSSYGGHQITIETRAIYLDETFVKTHQGSSIGSHIIISVSDTGVGIKKETLSKIFEPFYTTKKEGKGTGLGLSTVYGIVKQNNGSVYVYSEPQQGTTFNIYWPCITIEEQNTDEENNDEEILGGNETILVVEDDKSVIEFVRSFLTSLGYNVLTESNGKKALEFSKENPGLFQLLLTDVIMPEMNGKELAEELNKFIPNLKVLYASGYSGEHISNNGILDEELNLINKPYSMYMLAKKIREILDQK